MRGTVRHVKAIALLLLLPLAAACSNSKPFATTIGVLRPGATLTVKMAQGAVYAYQPAAGQPRDRFTLQPTALPKQTPPPVPRIQPTAGGVLVTAPHPLSSMLVRVPDGVTLVVDSQRGNVSVTDIGANAKVFARQGDVRIFLHQNYAQAAVGIGRLSVTMGATQWPGTLYFSTHRGNVDLALPSGAAFDVHLHTDNGTLFTDFNLHGTSQGTAETIDGAVNGGGAQRIDVETGDGSIRLLSLQAQA
jgi:hypothetical protein